MCAEVCAGDSPARGPSLVDERAGLGVTNPGYRGDTATALPPA